MLVTDGVGEWRRSGVWGSVWKARKDSFKSSKLVGVIAVCKCWNVWVSSCAVPCLITSCQRLTRRSNIRSRCISEQTFKLVFEITEQSIIISGEGQWARKRTARLGAGGCWLSAVRSSLRLPGAVGVAVAAHCSAGSRSSSRSSGCCSSRSGTSRSFSL